MAYTRFVLLPKSQAIVFSLALGPSGPFLGCALRQSIFSPRLRPASRSQTTQSYHKAFRSQTSSNDHTHALRVHVFTHFMIIISTDGACYFWNLNSIHLYYAQCVLFYLLYMYESSRVCARVRRSGTRQADACSVVRRILCAGCLLTKRLVTITLAYIAQCPITRYTKINTRSNIQWFYHNPKRMHKRTRFNCDCTQYTESYVVMSVG